MMQVLFIVGRGTERVDVVKDMLEDSKERGKPQYDLAPGINIIYII
jgi:hypothetical protein